MKILPQLSLTCILLLTSTSSAWSAMTLLINTTTQQFALVGSSTGTPTLSGGGFNPVTFLFIGDGSDFSEGNFNFAVTTIIPEDNFYTIDRADDDFSLRINSRPNEVSINFLFNSPDPLTITGTGVFIDYGTRLAGFDTPPPSERIDRLGSGAILFVNDGTGFDGGITVQIIPEPSAMVLGLLGFLPLLRRRRG